MSQRKDLNCLFWKSFFCCQIKDLMSLTAPTLTDDELLGSKPFKAPGTHLVFHDTTTWSPTPKKHPTNPSLSPGHPPLALAPNNYSSRAVPSTLSCSTITGNDHFLPTLTTNCSKTLFFLFLEVFRMMDFVSCTAAKQWNELAQQKIEI